MQERQDPEKEEGTFHQSSEKPELDRPPPSTTMIKKKLTYPIESGTWKMTISIA